MNIHHITDVEQARALGALLNGSSRRRPIALISTPAALTEPWIDVDDLDSEFGDLIEIHVIPTGDLTRALSNVLPDKTQVYGGAGRIYPVGHEWVSDLTRSPLRFAFDRTTGEKSTRQLIADGLGMAAAAGLIGGGSARPPQRMEGEVRGLPTTDRAVVRMADGTHATIAQELTLADVPLVQILRAGMSVAGAYDRAQRRLDIRGLLAERPTPTYSPGQAVLALVSEVSGAQVMLELVPGLRVTVTREAVTSNKNDDLRTLFTPDEVAVVRVVRTGPDWELSLIDIDDDEVPVPAPALIPGGPPWLAPPAEPAPWAPIEPSAPELPAQSDPGAISAEPGTSELPGIDESPIPPPPDSNTENQPGAPSPLMLDPKRRALAPRAVEPALPKGPSPSDSAVAPSVQQLHNAVAAAKAEVRQLSAQMDAMKSEHALLTSRLREANKEISGLHGDTRRLRTKLRKRSRDKAQTGATALFSEPEEQLRFEIDVAWAHRVPATDKADRPLGDYFFGPRFIDSIEVLEGIKRDKVFGVVVDVLTGLARELPSRELHQMRTSEAGGSPVRVREDGATAWRVSLQVNSPSARRLHYWQLPGGGIELARVGVHDDYTM